MPETTNRGARAQRKVTEEMVREMRERRAKGETLKSLAAWSGLCEPNVSRICRGQAWKHVA